MHSPNKKSRYCVCVFSCIICVYVVVLLQHRFVVIAVDLSSCDGHIFLCEFLWHGCVCVCES